MSIKLQISNDGSHTVYSGAFSETYHSINGAITESIHVFIEAGLRQMQKSQISIFEIGFGTGLNAFLSLLEADNRGIEITYDALELYPVGEEVYAALNYPKTLGTNREVAFKHIHTSNWGERVVITEHFSLQKHKIDIRAFKYPENNYDVVYFDAFSPVVQPELWGQEIFNAIYRSMCTGGILTTYCAKGEVRRTMQRAGFSVERLPGPPGKREMLRAIK
ncbi:MAG TPA: tRNA (5-methylaminomethyl-2-thiouridine)(34)-methyltransferase MnmD [Bacteroidales bacterium]|nr:tRNA (5-methylaminomethyl-2-thiouridine)(34)-methyltransferase MnmD [Bacteroidales bacterium]